MDLLIFMGVRFLDPWVHVENHSKHIQDHPSGERKKKACGDWILATIGHFCSMGGANLPPPPNCVCMCTRWVPIHPMWQCQSNMEEDIWAGLSLGHTEPCKDFIVLLGHHPYKQFDLKIDYTFQRPTWATGICWWEFRIMGRGSVLTCLFIVSPIPVEIFVVSRHHLFLFRTMKYLFLFLLSVHYCGLVIILRKR